MISDSTNTASFIIITVILTTIVVGTIVGNFFVITAILIDKNLQTTANQLVLSLAVADLMVACLVMPLGAYNEIYQGWYLSKEVCEFWTSADVLCCTASILNLLAIALDRYWAVTNVDYIYRRTRQRVNVMILCAWTVGAIVSLAPIFGWKDPDFANRVLDEHKCMVSQDVAYQVFATISTFYAPLVLLLALYWRIFQVARKRIRRKPGCQSAVLAEGSKNMKPLLGRQQVEQLSVARLAEDYALRANQRLLLCAQSDQLPAQVPTRPNEPGPNANNKTARQQTRLDLVAPSEALIALKVRDMEPRDDMHNENNEPARRSSERLPKQSELKSASKWNGRLYARESAAKAPARGEPEPAGCGCAAGSDWCCCCNSCELQIYANSCSQCKRQLERKRLKRCQGDANSASEPQINHRIGELSKVGAYLEAAQAKFSSTLQQQQQQQAPRHCGCEQRFARDKKIDKRRQSLSSSSDISPLALACANIDGSGSANSNRGLPEAGSSADSRRKVAVDLELRANFHSDSDSGSNSDLDLDLDVELGRAQERDGELLAAVSQSSSSAADDDYEELSLSASFPPPIELVTNRKLKRVLGNSPNGSCQVETIENYSQTVFHGAKVDSTAKSKKSQTTWKQQQQQHCDKLSTQPQKMYSNSDAQWREDGQFNCKLGTTTTNGGADNPQQATIIQSLDLKRKFRVMGQLVSFVQTSRSFHHQSSYSSQSGDEADRNQARGVASVGRAAFSASAAGKAALTVSSIADLQLAPQVTPARPSESKAPNSKRRENMDMKREKKAAKTLAIITGVFVCCWLPFFLNAIIMPVCGPNCVPNDLVLSVLLWLGYLNSLLNPIIYTIFSPDFRLAFRRLLCWPKLARSRGSMGGKRA